MSIKRLIPNSVKVRVKEFLGIARLEREINRCGSAHQSNHVQLKQLEERSASSVQLKQLEERLASLESVASFSKNIDLIRVGDFFYFVYEDDIPHYSHTPDKWRQHTKLSPTEIRSIVAEARTSDARRELHRTDAVARAVWSLSKSGQPVNLIYVGCSYGWHLMKVADFIQKQNLNCRIVGFDPGIAGTLTPPTLRLNHLYNIEFFNLAVSCADSHAIMHQIVGHSEDNKLVNFVDSPLRLSRLVETVTLDAFCAQQRIAGPTVLVIDTQGNEPEVIAGAARFLKNNVCVIVSEFTPWAVAPRMPAPEYLALLGTYGEVYNLGEVDQQAARIQDTAVSVSSKDLAAPPLPSLLEEKVTAENRDDFSRRILNQPPQWTDVMVIPEDHHLGRVVADDFDVARFAAASSCIVSRKAA